MIAIIIAEEAFRLSTKCYPCNSCYLWEWFKTRQARNFLYVVFAASLVFAIPRKWRLSTIIMLVPLLTMISICDLNASEYYKIICNIRPIEHVAAKINIANVLKSAKINPNILKTPIRQHTAAINSNHKASNMAGLLRSLKINPRILATQK